MGGLFMGIHIRACWSFKGYYFRIAITSSYVAPHGPT